MKVLGSDVDGEPRPEEVKCVEGPRQIAAAKFAHGVFEQDIDVGVVVRKQVTGLTRLPLSGCGMLAAR